MTLSRAAALAVLTALVAARPAAAEEIVVRTAAELQAALGSDRVVILEAGEYVFEGALQVKGVRNLILRGRDRSGTRILARDDYDDVLKVSESHGVSVENMTLGHHPDVAECVGGVLVFHRSKDVRAMGVTLFGSGVEGLTITEVDTALADGVEVRECTSSGMSVARSRGVLVRHSLFRENQIWGAVFNVAASEVVVEDSEVQHWGDAVDLVKPGHVPYYIDLEGEAPKQGATGQLTFRRGKLVGDVKLPTRGRPGVVLEDVDTSGVGGAAPPEAPFSAAAGEPCAAVELEAEARAKRIMELEDEVMRLRGLLEEAGVDPGP